MDDGELIEQILDECMVTNAEALAKAYIEMYGLTDDAAFSRLQSATRMLQEVEAIVQRYRDCVP